MLHTITLEPGESRIEDHWRFNAYLTASSPPRCIVRGIALDPEQKAPRRQKGQLATTLVLPMSPDEAIELALAISEAVTTANIPLPTGVLVRSGTA